MKKYVKFTEGEGVDLTANTPYLLEDDFYIIDDVGYEIGIRTPDRDGKCPHIKSKWQWCDENGKEVIGEKRN